MQPNIFSFHVHTMIHRYLQERLFQVDPAKGTVGFGASLHGWGLTLKEFAEININEKSSNDLYKIRNLYNRET